MFPTELTPFFWVLAFECNPRILVVYVSGRIINIAKLDVFSNNCAREVTLVPFCGRVGGVYNGHGFVEISAIFLFLTYFTRLNRCWFDGARFHGSAFRIE